MEPGGDSRDGDDKSAPCGWLSKISNKQSRLVEKIKDLGAAGFVAYGMLNTLYYCVAFLVVWLSMGEIPRGLGYTEASKRLAAVLAVVWMGSQVTKVPVAPSTYVRLAASMCAFCCADMTRGFGLHDMHDICLHLCI